MPKTGAIIVALGAFLVAAPPALAQSFAFYGAYAPPPPPPAGVFPLYYGPPCYVTLTGREREKGIRHWTGWCRY